MATINLVKLLMTPNNMLVRKYVEVIPKKNSYSIVESGFRQIIRSCDMMKPDTNLNDTFCSAYIFCLEDQQEEALDRLKTYLIERVTKSIDNVKDTLKRLEVGLVIISASKLENFEDK